MEADAKTFKDIRALIDLTYQALSTPDADTAGFFGHEDIAVAGSGQGELFYGPEQVGTVARMIATQGSPWVPEPVKVWRRGEVAWAQILGYVEILEEGATQRVPYATTGVFGHGPDGWEWLY